MGFLKFLQPVSFVCEMVFAAALKHGNLEMIMKQANLEAHAKFSVWVSEAASVPVTINL